MARDEFGRQAKEGRTMADRIELRRKMKSTFWERIPSPSSPPHSEPSSVDSSSSESVKKKKRKKKVPKLKKAKKAKAEHVPEQKPAEAIEEEFIGPKPILNVDTTEERMHYGKDLLPGEGAAIAQYVQRNMRVPRRGEVGWEGNEIERLETLGYVMSGSRHVAMNTVRLRKEEQVASIEAQREEVKRQLEEKQKREEEIMAEFRQMLHDRLTKTNSTIDERNQ